MRQWIDRKSFNPVVPADYSPAAFALAFAQNIFGSEFDRFAAIKLNEAPTNMVYCQL